jgi:hypothetical protein
MAPSPMPYLFEKIVEENGIIHAYLAESIFVNKVRLTVYYG